MTASKKVKNNSTFKENVTIIDFLPHPGPDVPYAIFPQPQQNLIPDSGGYVKSHPIY